MIGRHSRSRGYDPGLDIADALRERGVFAPAGEVETEPTMFRQAVGDYVEQFHSTASLAREHMSMAEAAEFDRAVEEVVAPYVVDGALELPIVAHIRWGRPLAA